MALAIPAVKGLLLLPGIFYTCTRAQEKAAEERATKGCCQGAESDLDEV